MERQSQGAFKELVHEVDERTGKQEACRQGHRLGMPMGKAEALPPRQLALLLTGQGSPMQLMVASCSEGLLNTSTERLPSNNAQTPALVSVAAMEHTLTKATKGRES